LEAKLPRRIFDGKRIFGVHIEFAFLKTNKNNDSVFEQASKTLKTKNNNTFLLIFFLQMNWKNDCIDFLKRFESSNNNDSSNRQGSLIWVVTNQDLLSSCVIEEFIANHLDRSCEEVAVVVCMPDRCAKIENGRARSMLRAMHVDRADEYRDDRKMRFGSTNNNSKQFTLAFYSAHTASFRGFSANTIFIDATGPETNHDRVMHLLYAVVLPQAACPSFRYVCVFSRLDMFECTHPELRKTESVEFRHVFGDGRNSTSCANVYALNRNDDDDDKTNVLVD
jgi:hypothetical protein